MNENGAATVGDGGDPRMRGLKNADQSSGPFSSVSRSDIFVIVPADLERYPAGTAFEV